MENLPETTKERNTMKSSKQTLRKKSERSVLDQYDAEARFNLGDDITIERVPSARSGHRVLRLDVLENARVPETHVQKDTPPRYVKV